MAAPHVTVLVDRTACIGSGRCVADAPDLIDLDAQNRAVVVGSSDGLSVDQATDLVDGCPAGAISVLVDGELLEL